MNCEEYRNEITANPSRSFGAGQNHAASCEACAEYRALLLALDEQLLRALAIPVPELELPDLDRIPADANVVTMPQRRVRKAPVWLGLAAGFALAAYVGLQFTATDTSNLPLSAQVIAHLDHEEYSRAVTTVPVPERTLESVVSDEVAMNPGIGLVTYARSCVINGKAIPHLVIQGEKGPVTLLLMPDEPVDGPVPLEGEAVNGVILPVGDGSIAIVGESDERLDEIGSRVVKSVKWKT